MKAIGIPASAGLFLCLLLATGVRAEEPGSVRLSLMEGDVQVKLQDAADWTEASINLPLFEHDRIWSPENSKAELQIQGGVFARAGDRTALDILTISRDSAQFFLDQGHLYINNRRGGIQTVQVDTPLASLRSYDNSIMLVDVTADGVNEISVLKGIVYAESRAGATRVSAGNTLTISGENSAQLSPIDAPDAWEQWNVDRDREVTAWNESSRYLPDELHQYSSDLDRNGQWDYVSDYGYAWFPTVVDAGWSPYSAGNWVWIRGDYVWVDYEPWGWAPMHYGRWVFIEPRGWCWVPPAPGAAYWGPGFVGWVVTPTVVAWVPLAPGEIYYGYGYYGPGSVNITTVNISTIVVNQHYRNAGARNAVFAARRDGFGTGRHAPERAPENPFEHGGRSRPGERHIVPPRVRPDQPIAVASPGTRERGHDSPHDRTAPPARGRDRDIPRTGDSSANNGRNERGRGEGSATAAVQPRVAQPPIAVVPQSQPPERFRRTRPEVLKNERPVVRQREASVFQQRAPQDLPVTRSQQPRVIDRGQGQGQGRPAGQKQREKHKER